MPQRLSRNLVHRNSDMNIAASRLACPRTGEKCRARSGMIPRPIASGRCVLMIESTNDLDMLLQTLQRCHTVIQ